MAPTPVFLPGKYHGQTSLVGYSPWGCKELETTEVTESFPGGTSGKEPTFQCMRLKKYWFDPWVRKIPWRMAWPPIPVFLPGESHGQRSLAVYGP